MSRSLGSTELISRYIFPCCIYINLSFFFSLLSWLNFYDGICYVIVRISREHSNSNYDCDFSYTVAFIIFRTFFWKNNNLFKDFDITFEIFGVVWYIKSNILRKFVLINFKIFLTNFYQELLKSERL